MQNMLSFWTADQAREFNEYRYTDVVYARIRIETNCPTCGWDAVSQSATRLDCPTCHGEGKLVTWVKYSLNARLMWSGLINFAYPFPSSGVEMDDCVITVPYEFVPVMDAVMNNERSYLQAGNKIVRPVSQHEHHIPGIVREYFYVCKLFSPEST